MPRRRRVCPVAVALAIAALSSGSATADPGPSCDRWLEASPREQLEVSMKTVQTRLDEARSSPLASCLLDGAHQISRRTTELCDAGAESFGAAVRQALDAGMARCMEGAPDEMHEARLGVARDLVARISAGDLQSAARRLVLPHHLSAKEQRKEAEFLERSLEIMTRELGYPADPSFTERFEGGHAEVGSGLLESWKGFPERLVPFATWYSREGAGFLTCRFVLTDRGWQLGALVFSLPSSRAGARGRMAEITGLLLRELAREF